ncbi:EamA family transporter [Pandoraea sputorum]|uniref:4-amino-4-deoxy-L-arabinose transferase n=1 Tax=Pandoraea sputorum TaxID=93222 RepID=A0A5E5BK57_9BURK|nr:EamA family transporter [Pandoraea sputorum]VVE84730.1 4-amino-4-deoxy-L-arabinose transferase [Pandoraea sputorum]
MGRVFDYLCIFATVILTAYGQVVLKWRIAKFGSLPAESLEKIRFLFSLFLDPYILSGFLAAFMAALCWMAAMTKFELSYAYPFTSLNFAVVLILSTLLLGEPISGQKIVGVVVIAFGTFIAAKG